LPPFEQPILIHCRLTPRLVARILPDGDRLPNSATEPRQQRRAICISEATRTGSTCAAARSIAAAATAGIDPGCMKTHIRNNSAQ
jgi:hypothetical protein